MADNKSKRGYQDRGKIDIHDRNETAYIKRKFGFTKLAIAVAMYVTNSVARKKVIKWLQVNWPRITRLKSTRPAK